ncbi:hypothetical protein AY600_02745 [Phormidium willei BDU 130791]|jgi:hypothetical protein|nr:hypothetical protein AY600_02745 [Phormidium willei BDU 130791]
MLSFSLIHAALSWLILLNLWWGFPSTVNETCRIYHSREICIISIKRSAKYYWEYRAEVRVDGQRRPLEKYDCRRQERIKRDGRRFPFEPSGAGDYICKTLN